MSQYNSIPRRRFYRNREKALIGGVCAGLADYFGFNLRVTRILAFIAFLMAMPMTLIVYFGTVFLVPTDPHITMPTIITMKNKLLFICFP